MKHVPKKIPGLAHVSTAKQAVELAQQGRTWWRDRTRWSVAVSSTNPLYEAVHRWFLDGAEQAAPPRALEARLATTYGQYEVDRRDEVRLFYDDRRPRETTIGGHRVTVSLAKAGQLPQSDKADSSSPAAVDVVSSFLQPDVLHFHARSQEGQQAVVAMLEGLVQSRVQRRPALYLLNNWGSWNRRDDLPERTLDSVVLADGQMERLRDDFDRFLNAERDYVRRGLPWHRGYLLHGPAGTGKTSIVRALAAHFGLDLWYAPLGDLKKDANLLTLIAEVRQRSILLLEDVDVFHASRSRDDAQEGVSIAGLLNALDGVSTPHGLVSIMTTNDVSVLDDALTRPGRIDLSEEIGLPDWGQVERIFRWFYETNHGGAPTGTQWKGTTADLVELFKQQDDPQAAWRAVLNGSTRP